MSASHLCTEQKEALDAAKAGQNIFITGNAGCGKTTTLREIIAFFKRKYGTTHCLTLEEAERAIETGRYDKTAFERRVAITAPTGVAATLMNGKTINSALGLGVVRRYADFMKKHHDRRLSQLRALHVLIIDEISMVSAEMFECIDHYLRRIRNSDKPFGGLQLIVSGDFYQLEPVQTREVARSAFPDAFWNRGYAFQCPSWKLCNFRCFQLTKLWRQTNDSEFAELLNRIKVGDRDALDELMARCKRPLPDADGILPTELFGTNAEADTLNKSSMNDLEGEMSVFKAEDTIVAPALSAEGRTKWMSNDFFRECQAPEALFLKIGAQVMLVKNLEFEGGSSMLVNGSRGVVVGFGEGKLPRVAFRNGRVITVGVTEFSHDLAPGITAVRKQVPLRLAWGITHYKIQGSTLDYAKVCLDRVFAYGQVYVALSRVRDMKSLEIACADGKRPMIEPAPAVKQFYQDMEGYNADEIWAKWMKEHPLCEIA